MTEKKFHVSDGNIRLDRFLHGCTGFSRRVLKESIQNSLVSVNNRVVVKPSFLLSPDDLVVFDYHVSEDEDVSWEDYRIEYMFEDEDLVVLYKPCGLLVHSSEGLREKTLIDYVRRDGISLYCQEGLQFRSGLVHRLDRMTEGLMVLVKTEEASQSLTEQFKQRTIEKGYVAMVKGNMQNDEIDIDQPIARHNIHDHRFCVSKGGKPSFSRVEVLKRYNSKTLCRVIPKTGRTHQIRVHLSFVGHPVLGDSVYGDASQRKGQLLQSYFLGFTHPRSMDRMRFSTAISERILS